MLNQFSRTELLFGREAMERLRQSRVAVFGIGRLYCSMHIRRKRLYAYGKIVSGIKAA